MSTDTNQTEPIGRTDHPAVLDRLENVYDPELDRSIVELDYIDEIEREDGEVTVRFTLPTAWCSPAFAWMMATDAREEVESLDDVERARIELDHHLHMEEINTGVNQGLSFEDVFDEAEDGPDEVRATLDHKARLSRQREAVETLLESGLTGNQIVTLTPADLDLEEEPATVYVHDRSVGIPADREPLAEYVKKAHETGVVSDESNPLFRTPEGDRINPDEFERVHAKTRLARTNMTGQGSICEALHDSRQSGLLDEDTEWGIDADAEWET
jgi:metal-sulfur cluster biosynthetic enzyme/nucleotide-binding universal stress UspA family protein